MLPARESCFLNDDSETYYFSPSAKVQLNDLYEDQEVEYFHNPMLRCYCDNVGTKIWGLCHPALLPHPIICPPPLSTHDMFVSGDYTYPYPPTCTADHKNNVWWAYREEHYCRWWTKSTPVYSTVFKFCSMIKAYIRRSSCVFCVYLNIRCNILSLALESTISHNSVCFCIE